MAEKVGKPPPPGSRPLPMKLFATWEVDRTPSNCVPRLCSLTLSRLVLLKSLGNDISSIIIAVKMQSSKRTLRSNELLLPPGGLLDTELDLNFSLQYPHFIKRDEANQLLIMLQRRKRYKNRTILGFKTLAEGTINLSQALQRTMDVDLELYNGESKEKRDVVARLSVLNISSTPVDQDEPGVRHKRVAMADTSDAQLAPLLLSLRRLTASHLRLPRGTPLSPTDRAAADFSDDDEDFSSNEENSDSEPMLDDSSLAPRRPRKTSRAKNSTARQRNLKQKFISLLKRFRISEDLDNDPEEIEQKLSGGDMDPTDIADLFDELEELSDSGPEMDTMSISSTPKPSLRPFFSSSRSLAQPDVLPIAGESPSCNFKKPPPPPPNQAPGNTAPKALFRERGSDRQSDESSKKADSDSHPENWTDHEHSDPPPMASSPPHAPLAQSESLEKAPKELKDGDRDRRTRLFARDRTTSGTKAKKSDVPRTPISAPELLGGPLHNENSQPRKSLMEQLSRLMPLDEAILPDHVILVPEGAANLAARLVERQQRVLSVSGTADVRAAMNCLISKLQKFCNSSAKPPLPVKVLIMGSDSLVSTIMRQYVELLSSKPLDWQNHFRFLIVPLGNNSFLARYLSSLDSMYAASFSGESWKELTERLDSKIECQEAMNRIQRYLVAANSYVALPVAEAMVTYKERSSDEESCQIFIPFINETRLGSQENGHTSLSLDMDESLPVLMASGSPPSGTLMSPSGMPSERKERTTPPSSPNVNTSYIQSASLTNAEPMELQIDYWQHPTVANSAAAAKGDQAKNKFESVKSTLKTSFRALQVCRLPGSGLIPNNLFTLTYTTKESKKKTVMRLGKKKEKEKESDAKNQVIEGVTRLICSAKAHNVPLKVFIDGMEWNGVKFFQLSAQWQTHIKHFPVALFNVPEPISG
ncbi:phosphofurin acidic cluster sorting protein 2 isoform X2 [Neocloeon triangulifer]|uniref:phosphofurin acidic cluster sorting protein 2 isoform X2 n=1 Tax=Neocloeon triangulifer TaxID=2078957 RepID=UPI00286F4A2A|nr:phosphofurin acidic cluster sorting protein 2 isoform X2 [Neocloeon triangulifer]